MSRNTAARTVGFVLGYICFFQSVRLVFLTIITYALLKTGGLAGEHGNLQRIGEVARANQALAYGVAALAYILLLEAMQPLSRTRLKEVFNLQELKSCFSANAIGGFVLACVFVLGSVMAGYMTLLGVYMKFDEVLFSLSSSAVFAGALVLMIVVEEYLFRRILEPFLAERWGPVRTLVLSSLLYLLIKFMQFDLSWLEAVNLVLLNLTLSMIARSNRTPMASAVFESVFLIVTHMMFGLPYMSQDMPGIFLLRATSEEGLGQLLSGGAYGPEGGLIMAVLFLIYLYMPQIRSSNI